MTLVEQFLKKEGIPIVSDTLEIANKLNQALDLIFDPVQREIDFDYALSEWRDGRTPSIIERILK